MEQVFGEPAPWAIKHIEDFFPDYGWPGEWPTSFIPAVRDGWWSDRTILYPESQLLLQLTPNLKMIDVLGLPQAGKSTILANITQFKEFLKALDKKGWTLEIINEFFVPYFPIHSEKDWNYSLFIQQWKYSFWISKIARLQDRALGGEKIIVVSDKGLFDTLVMWFINGSTQSPELRVPENFRDYLRAHMELVAYTQVVARKICSAVVMGISHDEARRRRALAGKRYPGWVTGSDILWDEFSGWYSHVIDRVIPSFGMEGTGLLVLNGEDEVKTNVKRLSEYLLHVAEKW